MISVNVAGLLYNSVQCNSFLFVRSRRGLWLTGYRTRQFHL